MSVLLASLLGASGLAAAQLRVASAVALALVGVALAVPLLGRRLEAVLAPVGRAAPGISSRSGGLADGLAIGAAIGLVWAPCVGPIMAAVLVTAATSGPTAATVRAVRRVRRRRGGAAPGRRHARPARHRMGREPRGPGADAAGARRDHGGREPGGRDRLRHVTGERPSGTASVPDPAAGSAAAAPTSPPRATPRLPAPIAADLPASAQLGDLGPAPELAGITDWINSPPLTLARAPRQGGAGPLLDLRLHQLHPRPAVREGVVREVRGRGPRRDRGPHAGALLRARHRQRPQGRRRRRRHVPRGVRPRLRHVERLRQPAPGRPSTWSTERAASATCTRARATTRARRRPSASCSSRRADGDRC